MAKVTMKIEGMDTLKRALTSAPQIVRKHSASAVWLSSLHVASRARALVPVDTGDLKRSIDTSHGEGQLFAYVGLNTVDTHYWRFVEFGTINRAATPFFRPAAEASAGFFIAQMKDVGSHVEHELTIRGGG